MLPEVSKILIEKFHTENRVELYDLMIEAEALRKDQKFLHKQIISLKEKIGWNERRLREIYNYPSIKREQTKAYRQLYKECRRVSV